MKLKRTPALADAPENCALISRLLATLLVACAVLLGGVTTALAEVPAGYTTGVNNPANTTVDFFDYWIGSQGANDTQGTETGWVNSGGYPVNDGINYHHTLLFHGGDGNHPATGSDQFTGMYNSHTSDPYQYPSDYYGPVVQGIVQDTLQDNGDGTYGYPSLSPNRQGTFTTMNATAGGPPSVHNNEWLFYTTYNYWTGRYETNGDNGESLEYLFNPNTGTYIWEDGERTTIDSSSSNYVDGKASYSNVNGLFTIDEQGYYVYDSALTSAHYEERDQRFYLKDSGGAYGFWPLDEYSGGATHNHYMGMHMSMPFSMPQDGLVLNPQGQYKPMTFTFTGDDDVWVYIDGQLVGDLGGIHQPSSLEINFADGTVKVNRSDINSHLVRDTDGRLSSEYPEYVETLYLSPEYAPEGYDTSKCLFPAGTFDAGTNHRLDFYYLERGAGDSNLEIRYNMISTADFTAHKAMAESSSHTLREDDFQFELIGLDGLYSMEDSDGRTASPVTDAGDAYTSPIMPLLPGNASHDVAGQWHEPGDVSRKYEPNLPAETSTMPAISSDVATGGRTYTVGCSGNGDVVFGNADIPEQWDYVQDRNNPAAGCWYGYRYIIREVIPSDATDNGDGTYTKDGIVYTQQTFYMVACPVREPDTGKIGYKKTYYTDDTFTERLGIPFVSFLNLDGDSNVEHPTITASKMINSGGESLQDPGAELSNKFAFALYDEFPGESSTPIATASNTDTNSDEDELPNEIVFDGNEIPLPAFTAVDFGDEDEAEVSRTYYIKETIPTGATDNGDGTFTLDGAVYKYDTNVYYVTVTATFDKTNDDITFEYAYGIASIDEEGAVELTPFGEGTNPDSPSSSPIFVNTPQNTTVAATKVWQDKDPGMATCHGDVELTLYMMVDGEKVSATDYNDSPVPVITLKQSADDGSYSITGPDGAAIEGEATLSYTDDDSHWPIVTWNNLRKYDSNGDPIEYVVEETLVPSGYTSAVSGTTSDGFTVTNTQKPLSLAVQKVSKPDGAGEDELGTPLPGVTFTLTRVDTSTEDWASYPESASEYYYSGELVTALNDEGTEASVVFENGDAGLAPGIYKIEETAVPDGIQRATNPWYVQLFADGQWRYVEKGSIPEDDEGLTTEGFDPETRVFTLTLANYEVPPLPSSGGPGDMPLLIAGAVMVIAAMTLLLKSSWRASS